MEPTESAVKVVCDAGPIIHLDELECLSLLNDFQNILVPNSVCKEVNRHRPLALKRSELTLTYCDQQYPNDELLCTLCRIFSLDAGETEALAVMERNPMAMFLTDDAAARLVAKQVGFNVHGTIGILVRAVRRGMMKPKQLVRILEEIPLKSTLYIKSSLLEEIIHKIKNKFQL